MTAPVEPWQPAATTLAPAGMVCTEDHLAASAGVGMLRMGGSAADAAVAASAVLAVIAQHRCGIGGDLLAVVVPPGGEPVALESAGFAGSGADPDRLRAEGHRGMPFRGDVRSVTVPGCVDGWLALHDRYGRLPLPDVLEPARCYAASGFPATPSLLAAIPVIANVEGADDFTARRGTVIRRPGLVRIFEAIGRKGRGGFYEGEFGAGLRRVGAGLFSEQDLATCIARWRPAARLDAWGHTFWTAPPPSQGYLALAAGWIASGLDLPDDPDDPAWAHLLIEAARQAGWDRADVLHDGADPLSLLDTDLLTARRARVDRARAASLAESYGPGGTIGLCAVDGERLGVSMLQSNAAGWGAHVAVPEVGVFLHNRGIGFSLEPGHPGEYRPGRRPAHTLSPLAVTAPGGALQAVAATMGGDGQPQILLQLLARALRSAQEPATAVSAGRWVLADPEEPSGFNTWQARGRVRVRVEGHAPPGWDPGLSERGHLVARAEPFADDFGHAQYIEVRADHLAGAADPRSRAGGAAGW